MKPGLLARLKTYGIVSFLAAITAFLFFCEYERRWLLGHLYLFLGVGLTGIAGWRLNRLLRERFSSASRSLHDLDAAQREQALEVARLRKTSQGLESEKARLESLLYSVMDPLAAKMAVTGELKADTRPVSVLSADLPAFALPPDRAPADADVRQLGRFFASMESVLARYWGHLDRYSGGGVLAEFGMPYASEPHALLAAMAALKMQERMAMGDFPWRMRVGLASGSCWVGPVGSGERLSYTALGGAVSAAVRLRGLCPPGSVCMDGTMAKELGRWFTLRRLGVLPESRSLAVAREGGASSAETLAALGSEVHEVLGLKDPLADERRIPARAAETYRELSRAVRLPLDEMLPLEALERAIGHAQTTAALAGAIARAMGLGERERRTAFLAGCLHDVGKRNVPERLLRYESSLEDLPENERALVQDHASQAERSLAEIGLPVNPALLETIAAHHERFDGSGYPKGLAGDRIRIEARIVAVADVYDTLTSWRPYRSPLDPVATLAELAREAQAGRHDPAVVRALRGLFE